MQLSSIPAKFPIPWGNSAGSGYIRAIPVASQIGVNAGYASLTDGFVPLNGTPIAAGGVPPFEQDMNGILKQITQWNQWQQAGGPLYYDATFAGEIDGYPNGAIVPSALVPGNFWMSTVDNNETNPDDPTSSSGWQQVGTLTGTPIPWMSSTIPAGYVPLQPSYTIGSAASGATYASAAALFLYLFVWNGFSNSQCPVTGGRGANAYADFTAAKPMQVPSMAGTGVVGQANSGSSLSGVPVTSGNVNTPGSIIGQNLHQLTTAELATTSLSFTGTAGPVSVNTSVSVLYVGGGFSLGTGTSLGISYSTTTSTGTFTPAGSVSSFGSNTAHNTVSQSMAVNWIMKL